jgi:hypothetical protein
MCNSKYHRPGCTCGFGGSGHLGRRGPSYATSVCSNAFLQPNDPSISGQPRSAMPDTSIETGWSIATLPRPLTYWTNCFVDGGCDAKVIYHTNGYGDCILFDPPLLGPPWKNIHACWKEHCRERGSRPSLSPLESSLLDHGFDGTYYDPGGSEVLPPAKPSNRRVTCVGFLCSRPAESKRLDLSCERLDTPSWVRFVVSEGGRLFPFLVPLVVATRVKQFEMVRVLGGWIRIADDVLLVAERMTILKYPNVRSKTIRVLSLGRIRRCAYCGSPLSRKAWGINRSRHLECGDCAVLRRNLSPSQFVRAIRRIAKYHLGLGDQNDVEKA